MAYDPADWDTADETAKDTAQHFYADSSGAHVTDETGAELLLTSNGIDIKDEDSNTTAFFHSDGAQIGADGESHIAISENSITMSVLYYNPWIPQPQYVIRDIFNIQYNVSNNYVYVFAPTDSLWLQAAYGNVTIASTDADANASIRLRAGKMIVADENGNPLWTGTAQQMADALTKPRFYQGSKTVNVGSTNITSCTLWLKAAFESEFNTTDASKCMLWVCNGNVQAGQTGPVQAEYWTASQIGWHARWTANATGNKQFNYMVAVPPAYSTV